MQNDGVSDCQIYRTTGEKKIIKIDVSGSTSYPQRQYFLQWHVVPRDKERFKFTVFPSTRGHRIILDSSRRRSPDTRVYKYIYRPRRRGPLSVEASTSDSVFVVMLHIILLYYVFDCVTLPLWLYWPANPLQNCDTQIPMLIRITYLIETH